MVFVNNVEYYLNVSPVSEESLGQVGSDLKKKGEKKQNRDRTTMLKLLWRTIHSDTVIMNFVCEVRSKIKQSGCKKQKKTQRIKLNQVNTT